MANKFRKKIPKVQEVEITLEPKPDEVVVNKQPEVVVVKKEQPKKNIKTIRIGHKELGWVWRDVPTEDGK